MEAKQYLLQIKFQNENIRNQQEYIQRLKESLCIVGINYDKERVQTSPDFDKFASVFSKIDEEEHRLVEMKEELVKVRVKIISRIHELQNDRFENILNYMYVDGDDLGRIAYKMNFSYEYVKELHTKALQVFEEKFLLNPP